jgi:uroporphyrinogen-III synthase
VNAGAPLAGRRIVVTRPAAESQGLAEAIRAAGGEALIFPAIEIGPAPEPAQVAKLLSGLDRFDLVVFISPTAVRAAFAWIDAAGGWPRPDGAGRPRAAAVGPGTARALVERGVPTVLVPDGQHDSEGLLALSALERVAGWQILIVRGAGGRETLARTLSSRGAVVRYAECYRRGPPTWDPGPLAERFAAGGVDAVVLLSAEAIDNLVRHLGPCAEALRATHVVVPHERVAAAATRAGFTRVATAAGGERGIVATLALSARAGGVARGPASC